MDGKTSSGWTCYSAPGRVCLYGEHQDYLGLKVIPAAINLRTFVKVKPLSEPIVQVHSSNLKTSDSFPLQATLPFKKNPFDYLRAVVRVLFKQGYGDNLGGLQVIIDSSVPIGSGLSSSAALLVSWLNALNAECSLGLSPKEIGEIAYLAEHGEMGINCGIMDQFSSAIGGVFALNCDSPPYTITPCAKEFTGLVIGDSLVRRSANEPLTILKNHLFSAQEKIFAAAGFSLKTLTLDQLESYKNQLNPEEYIRLAGAINIRDYTQEAFDILTTGNSNDDKRLGELLTLQHTMLRDNLQVSIPKLDRLVSASIEAGAFGAKLSGAGFGGCIVAFAPGNEKAVAQAIESAGGKAALCTTDFGGRKEEKC